MSRVSLTVFLLLFPVVLLPQDKEAVQDQVASTLTRVGQTAPNFSVSTIDGQIVDISSLKGKVVLINFFATWCGPCMKEMPELEKEIWQAFKHDSLVVIAIGREHSKEELEKFNEKKGFTFLIAPDPKREVYSLFATKYIPRNYLIDRTGKIVYQAVGYTEEEFAQLKSEIQKLLVKE